MVLKQDFNLIITIVHRGFSDPVINIAKSAGAASMRAIGVCTCSGMLAATLVGIIFVPSFYAIFQRVREFVKGEKRPPCPSAAAAS